jgi:uncharacterized protein
MKKRIVGLDVARAFAIIGMIIVNFKVTLGDKGAPWLKTIAGIFDGKAAATFVVLAGVGISLMAKSAIKNQDIEKLQKTKNNLVKRALFLWAIGLIFYIVWPADILHFYGVYIIITALVINSSNRALLGLTASLIIVYPFTMLLISYEQGWNFDNLEYIDFLTIKGFFRNLFLNGFHPVLPWVAFMLFGLWFGRKNLNDVIFIKKALLWSTIAFILIQGLSFLTIELLVDSTTTKAELSEIFGTNPMPPLPFYMISGCSISIFIISICILAAKQFESSKIILTLAHTGQLALTFYIAHIVVGIGIITTIYPKELGTYSLAFSIGSALLFSVSCIVFASFWRRKFSGGPLELLMRKITG